MASERPREDGRNEYEADRKERDPQPDRLEMAGHACRTALERARALDEQQWQGSRGRADRCRDEGRGDGGDPAPATPRAAVDYARLPSCPPQRDGRGDRSQSD